MQRLISQIVASILTIYLISSFISGVSIEVLPNSYFLGFKITQKWQIILILGFVLGLINFFVKPILNLLTLPLKILTFGLFSLILNMILLKILDWFFLEFEILTLSALFWSGLILGLVNLFFGLK
jgi:putative membrane protein